MCFSGFDYGGVQRYVHTPALNYKTNFRPWESGSRRSRCIITSTSGRMQVRSRRDASYTGAGGFLPVAEDVSRLSKSTLHANKGGIPHSMRERIFGTVTSGEPVPLVPVLPLGVFHGRDPWGARYYGDV